MTMGETKPANQGIPPAKEPGQTSDPKAGSTSTPATVTYTQVDLEKHTSDALTEQGRRHKVAIDAVTLDRNSLKEIKDDREELQRQLDNSTSSDPEKNNVSKLLKEANDRIKTATKIEHGNADRFLRADKIERGETIKVIADGFEGADIAKLTALCEATNIFSEEQIRNAAATIWPKKFISPAGTPTPAPAAVVTQPPAYSGMTNGGQDQEPDSAKGKMKAGWDELHKK